MAFQFLACGPDEVPTPTGNGSGNQNAPDTMEMFSDFSWLINKVYKDGVSDQTSFLIGCSYSIFDDGTYLFNIPGYNSASGTWDFGTEGKHIVNIRNQGGGSVWTIVSLGDSSLVVKAKSNSDASVYKYEMSKQ